MSSSLELDSAQFIRTIEWDMMDKTKFFPLSMLSSFATRSCFYPLTLIKTQLQVQFKSDVYSGMIDCGTKIFRAEGAAGLYRGFWISSVQIFSGVFYISTYEGVRHLLTQNGCGPQVKSLVAGGCASLVGQTIIVPFDVISQHAMVLGMGAQGSSVNPLGIQSKGRSRLNISLDIAKEILRRDGLKGYYRGYTASLIAYVPNSAMWWTFYHFYEGNLLFVIFLQYIIRVFVLYIYVDKLLSVLPPNVSHLLVQSVAGSLGGFTTTIITNPLDIVRARLQVRDK